ncbi:MAG: glycosyltransferase [Cytophagaceae bacterium]|nr:glycosyltransferase [Cytophagaceae bacterium]
MKKILIASILKPVSDPRMYEKIAISLAKESGFEIHVAGYKGAVQTIPQNVRVYPLFSFKRLSFGRILAPWKIYKLYLKVKPESIIITTHDLLIVTCIYKILFGGKFIYDVQENYYRNIAFTNTFPPLIRHIIASWVRLKEYLSRPFIDHYFLAEKNYEKEFSFSKGKSTILENKASKPEPFGTPLIKEPGRKTLLYSGTISENYGVFEAIEFAKNLHQKNSSIHLTIIGYSAKNEVFERVKKAIEGHPYIRLTGGNTLVPHHEIIAEIRKSDFGLLPYQPNKSTINCIPTKLYEYLAFGLPIIVQTNPIWEEIITKYQAGFSLDFAQPRLKETLNLIQNGSFYPLKPGPEIYWQAEETQLLQAIFKILSTTESAS